MGSRKHQNRVGIKFYIMKKLKFFILSLTLIFAFGCSNETIEPTQTALEKEIARIEANGGVIISITDTTITLDKNGNIQRAPMGPGPITWQ